MDIKRYFDENDGLGVLATADAEGNVNTAVYAKPHVMEDGQIAFIMREKLTHKNILQNRQASYLFKADSAGYAGVRLYLLMTREEQDEEKIKALQRRKRDSEDDKAHGPKYLVFFEIQKILNLIGDKTPDISI